MALGSPAISGCDVPTPASETVAIGDVAAWVVPAPNKMGARCVDVANSHVCWDASCKGGVCATDRPLPRMPRLSPLGWRCVGAGDARSCADRQALVGRFECDARGRCRQRYPRVPDDGEWNCVDAAGAVVCAGGDRPAGVVASRLKPEASGWICGKRRGGTPEGQRVCVDFSPDFPRAATRGSHWRCSWENGAAARTCEPADNLHYLGDSCDPETPCVDGALCVSERCVPQTPDPNCAFDADCDSGRCRFGTCVGAEDTRRAAQSPVEPPRPRTALATQTSTARYALLTGHEALRTLRRRPKNNALQASPPGQILGAWRTGGALLLELPLDATPVQVVVPGACPITLDPSTIGTDATLQVPLEPLFTLGPHRPQLGYDAPFEVNAHVGCDAAREGRLEWRQLSGPPLKDLTVTERGFRLSARSATRREQLPDPLPQGIVPVSPHSRGEVILAATWKAPSSGLASSSQPVEKRIRIAAAARSRGLPNVPVGVGQILAGAGWRVAQRPGADGPHTRIAPAGHPPPSPIIESGDGMTTFTPPWSGDWLLEDSTGEELRLRAASFDETPLDCSRAPCHELIGASSATSPMTHAFARRRDTFPSSRSTSEPDDVTCVEGCHTTGEVGANDGGFSHVALAFDSAPPAASAWESLPRPLRRLGGVGCLGCHGPGAVPIKSNRWTLLRVGVCATCHDAPPRYSHVLAWSVSAMATADRDPRTREAPCNGCHTTWGFLAAQGVSSGRRPAAVPVPADPARAAETPAMGITCVACHAPHEAHGANSPANTGPNAALLRQVPLPALLADIAPKQHSLGGPCLTCHSPDPATDTPAASSAAIWAARGGIDPISGRAMRGSANPKACVSCHNLPAPGADPTTRGADHAFAAHSEDGDEANTRLQARARQLWAEFLTRNVLHRATPPHSSPPSKSLPRHAAVLGATLDRDTPLGRAAYNVLLVGEDSGAGFHNPTYADELLTAAQRALTTPRSADAPSRKATP